ncbi:hypothetical protein BKA62DRAFT_488822 [Auriculariales sp. MPI-PUGE-AT-0066]|nr:hypothetical protein BKA62DRAFT_488822 [Auriculariales sp. MPI-PUGE-AT-0066]
MSKPLPITPCVPLLLGFGMKIVCVCGAGWGLYTTVTPPRRTSSGNPEGADTQAPTIPVRSTKQHPTGLAQALSIGSAALELSLASATNNWMMTPRLLAGGLLGIAGGILRQKCYAMLGARFTFNISSHNRSNLPLITTGPYALVRHPSYTAAMVTLCSFWMAFFDRRTCLGNLAAGWGTTYIAPLALIVPTLFVRRTLAEEAILQEEFQYEWLAYAKQTRWRLVPGLW